MRFIIAFVCLFLFMGCDKPGDCIKSTGPIVTSEIGIADFDKIIVHNGIALVITQGPDYKIVVETGENLIDDIEFKKTDKTLTIQDNTTCNWVREYGQTVVYITAPNLTEIISKTEKNIISNGVVTFPDLRLVAMDNYDGYEGVGTGDFIFQVDNKNLYLECNSFSTFSISGHTNALSAYIYEANGIIDTAELKAENIQLYHRGTNNMKVHPINSIAGNIYNLGNVIAVSRPPTVNVVEHYKGKLIFE